ncbi:hypothetical protein, conserved [Trypanosoma brucei brucei TREU927]|uniref:Protein YIPF n=1 Tax=Trypanosoma brucei brucei (strain 927/4 GUTat10.1) TaxID=185431 RepID=Q585Q6_TRYB2|nr:hypothetical protein, conserved [Trypanosoma brucei brucei TREU927]AAX79706.1 hypothetical protein, conserved [Trypanosoma brucei]AAZ11717.1 hypothetical protein, conserved [Trypanosoma brucei brucei TREU927]
MAASRSDEPFDPFKEFGGSPAPVAAPPTAATPFQPPMAQPTTASYGQTPQPYAPMSQPTAATPFQPPMAQPTAASYGQPPQPYAPMSQPSPQPYAQPNQPFAGVTGTYGGQPSGPQMSPSPTGMVPPAGVPGGTYGSQSPPPPLQQQQGGEIFAQPSMKIWTIEFYQQFFDVTTEVVLNRMRDSLIPTMTPDYMKNHTWVAGTGSLADVATDGQDTANTVKPDLYGPFWICTTLWMLLGIVSNIMSRIEYGRNPNHDKKWTYDFTMASIASLVIYLYCFGFSCILWGVMRFKSLPLSLTDTLCLYGYSMFVFIPITILCAIPISFVQWFLVLMGGGLSTAYLLTNFGKLWKAMLPAQWHLGLSGLVAVLHLLITLSFKFYFLNYSF